MTFDAQPTLVSNAVVLRPLAAADWDALFAVAADPLIWAGHPAHDRWQEPVFRAFFADALASGGGLLALDPATGAVVGTSRFDATRGQLDEIEIGWTFIARDARGTGVNPAMKRLMIGHALASVERVIFFVGDTNTRSQRAIERIGGILTDRTHAAVMAGQPVRHLVYAIDRAGFAAGPLMNVT